MSGVARAAGRAASDWSAANLSRPCGIARNRELHDGAAQVAHAVEEDDRPGRVRYRITRV